MCFWERDESMSERHWNSTILLSSMWMKRKCCSFSCEQNKQSDCQTVSVFSV